MKYPEVWGEWVTLCMLHEDTAPSISRFGDGEFKLVDGKEYVRERRNKKLTAEIRDVLYNAPDNLILGIPTMDESGPKSASWHRHKTRFAKLLEPCEEKHLYSAFITRPDSAPWIDKIEYAQFFESLWVGKRAAVLCEKKGSALRLVREGARRCKWFECPHEGAYAQIDDFEREIAEYMPDVAILSAGVTATCLAARLARRGIQAIDFGSAGSFLMRHLYP